MSSRTPYVNVAQQKGLHRIWFFKVHVDLHSSLVRIHVRSLARALYFFFFFSRAYKKIYSRRQAGGEAASFHFSICQCLLPQKCAGVIFTRTSTPTCPHSCRHYINTCPTASLRVVRDLISDTVHIDSSSDQLEMPLLTMSNAEMGWRDSRDTLGGPKRFKMPENKPDHFHLGLEN